MHIISESVRHLPSWCDNYNVSEKIIINVSEILSILLWQLQSQRDTYHFSLIIQSQWDSYHLSVTFTISVRHLPSRCDISPRRPCGHSVWSPGLSESCWACCSSPEVWPQSCAATTKTASFSLHSLHRYNRLWLWELLALPHWNKFLCFMLQYKSNLYLEKVQQNLSKALQNWWNFPYF